MSEKRTFILQPLPHPSRRLAIEAIRDAEDGMVVTIAEETRSQEQNRLLWPLLSLWAKNKKLCINGEFVEAPKEFWKVILLAEFRKQHRVPQLLALGLSGELVPLGWETKAMPKREFGDFLTFVLAETSERGWELPPRVEENCWEYLGRVA